MLQQLQGADVDSFPHHNLNSDLALWISSPQRLVKEARLRCERISCRPKSMILNLGVRCDRSARGTDGGPASTRMLRTYIEPW